MHKILLFTVILSLFFVGCNKKGVIKNIKNINQQKRFCKNPRSKICPMIYMPVCGKPTYKTYSNGCVACSDKKVNYFTQGKCK
jgi:hypothetical protein